MADPEIDVVALTKTYFEVWNSHDEAALRGLHADASSLHDWDATHGPTNAAVAAGVAGAALTNPLDVIRNEMFKFEENFGQTVTRLLRTEGWSFCLRGMQRNLIAVAVPIAMTIFLTDSLIEMLLQQRSRSHAQQQRN